MSATITSFPNPDEIISDDDAEYDAGTAYANAALASIRQGLVGKSEMFASAVWDVIYDVFDDVE